MASVTTEKRNGRTRYRVCWRDADKRRKSIRLAGVAKKQAEEIARRVAGLNAAQISGRSLDPSLAAWVARIGEELAEKLARAGLIEPRQTATLDAFLQGYIQGRKNDVEPRTIANLEATRKKLTHYFGTNRVLRTITEGNAHDWQQKLFETLSRVTVAGHTKRAKQFFLYAQKSRMVESSVFAEPVAGSQANDNRKVFVERRVIDALVEHAPDAEWRLLIALARYGGLRNPSETLRLRWQDIDWAKKRIQVTSPKTKRHKPSRVIPLFPELEPYLTEAFELAGAGAVYCIERYRSQSVNLRTGLQKIMDRAAVSTWPRLWQNLRASRETELANEYPIQVVTAWIGNSPAIANKHYLCVTEDHFHRATSKPERVAQGVETKRATGADRAREQPQPMVREIH